MELESLTDDDGDVFEVAAAATDDGIRVQSESDSIVAPPHTAGRRTRSGTRTACCRAS